MIEAGSIPRIRLLSDILADQSDPTPTPSSIGPDGVSSPTGPRPAAASAGRRPGPLRHPAPSGPSGSAREPSWQRAGSKAPGSVRHSRGSEPLRVGILTGAAGRTWAVGTARGAGVPRVAARGLRSATPPARVGCVSRPLPIVVVGAGLAGLAAAGALEATGRPVVVLESTARIGGRARTIRVGVARLDDGAQFFTVRTDELAHRVAEWSAAEEVFEWCRGFDAPDGHPRYAAVGGMGRLARLLGGDVRIHRRAEVGRITPHSDGLLLDVVHHGADDRRHRSGPSTPATTMARETLQAAAVVLTPPVPVGLGLLDPAAVASVPAPLGHLAYRRVVCLRAGLDRPARLPSSGAHRPEDGPFSILVDQAAKGISPTPALVALATPERSAGLPDDDTETAHLLLDDARSYLGRARVLWSSVARWEYAEPVSTWPEPAVEIGPFGGDGLIVFAGDAFAGPRVEGAITSGWAAARLLAERA